VSGKFLLDTNVIIALFAKEPVVHERLSNADEVFEALKRNRLEEEITIINKLCEEIKWDKKQSRVKLKGFATLSVALPFSNTRNVIWNFKHIVRFEKIQKFK
jgi:predicted nucleic acid-binding protein